MAAQAGRNGMPASSIAPVIARVLCMRVVRGDIRRPKAARELSVGWFRR